MNAVSNQPNNELNIFRVTQIINCQLETSDFQNEAMARGTEIHDTFARELLMDLTPTLYSTKQVKKMKWEVYSLETRTNRVYEKQDLKFIVTGKYDLLAGEKQGLIMSDLKTGKAYEDKHKAQLGAYIWVNSLESENIKGCILYEDLNETAFYTRKECLDAWFSALEKFCEKLKNAGKGSYKIESLNPILLKYAELKMQEKEIKEALDVIKSNVEEEVKRSEGKKIETDLFAFSLRERKSGGELELKKSATAGLISFLEGEGKLLEYFEKTQEKTTPYLNFSFKKGA